MRQIILMLMMVWIIPVAAFAAPSAVGSFATESSPPASTRYLVDVPGVGTRNVTQQVLDNRYTPASHGTRTDNPHQTDKAQIGLGNVDNTSDAMKPISTATQDALDGKSDTGHGHAGTYEPANANIQSHIGNTSNPHSVTKAQVGLGNVDNTSDTAKPVSTAQQTALDLKAPIASPTFTGTVTAPAYNTSAADGQHAIRPYNSVPYSDTPAVGMIQTTPTGPQWYNGSSWEAIGAGGGTWGSITGTLSDQTDLQGALGGKQDTLGYTAENAANKDTDPTLAANSDTKYPSQKAVKAYVDALNAQIVNLTTAMSNFGVDTTPPDLLRNAPATTTPTGNTSSLTINYTATDTCPSAPCMDATHPLQYAINGGSAVDFTSGSDAVLSGFLANTPTPVVVTAKNKAGMTTPETITYTYQTPVASASPTSKAFADTNNGASSAAQTFTITNTGLANLTLSPGLSLTGADAGQFALSKGTCTDGATITPAGTCTASVTLSPSSAGAKTASLLIDSNAADVTAGLSGTGVTPLVFGCTGSELFCTSWEDGSDALNTGGSFVFNTSTGTPTRVATGGFKSNAALQIDAAERVASNNGSSWNMTNVYARVAFKMSAETVNGSTGETIMSLYNSTSFDRVYVRIKEDSSDYDSTVLVGLEAKPTSDTTVVVGSTYAISLNTWYQVIVHYQASSIVEMTLYDANGTSLHSWSTPVTVSNDIDQVRIGSLEADRFTGLLDAFAFSNTPISPLN